MIEDPLMKRVGREYNTGKCLDYNDAGKFGAQYCVNSLNLCLYKTLDINSYPLFNMCISYTDTSIVSENNYVGRESVTGFCLLSGYYYLSGIKFC